MDKIQNRLEGIKFWVMLLFFLVFSQSDVLRITKDFIFSNHPPRVVEIPADQELVDLGFEAGQVWFLTQERTEGHVPHKYYASHPRSFGQVEIIEQ